MKTNKILIIIIVILSISVLIIGGYVLFNRVIDKNNFISNDSDDIVIDGEYNTGDVLISREEALVVIKDLARKYFEYKHSLGPYCGDTDYEDYISFGSYETQDFRDYWASTMFKSINEIKEYYESIMTEELIPNYLDDGVSYIEQDGKLYCQLSHKGCGDTYVEDASMFIINNIDSDSITAEVILSSETCGPLMTRREGIIEITKTANGNYVISKYDVQISDLD